MATYRIRPCARLSGEITVHSAKNAVLPLMCGALLTRETVTIEQIPALTDVKTLTDILRDCGVLMHADQAEKLLTMTADSPRSPRREDLLSRMRASVLVMGPLLARTGYARVALPGGCAIGQRPIDLHLKGMEALGAHVEQTPGFVTLRGKLRGGNVYLDFPSVGATENILMAAALARGTTRIENAAKEPEIADLCDFLTQMGAHISGGGTSTILIEGRETLHGCRYRPIPDRIEAGTLLCAAAQVGAGHARSTQRMPAADERDSVLNANTRAHAYHLPRVHEAVLKDGFEEHGRAAQTERQRHHRGLHVRRKTRIRQRANLQRLGRAARQSQTRRAFPQRHAAFAQLIQHRAHVFRAHAA